MAKLTKFKAQKVEFPTHYRIEDTNRGDNQIKRITPEYGNVNEPGTPETEDIYDGLQLGSVHTLQAIKSTNLGIDYYSCTLDGLTEFGLKTDLKIRLTVDSKNENINPKLRLNGQDYTILKEYNGTLKNLDIGDFRKNKTYELTYNGSQFVIINITDLATETVPGIITYAKIKEVAPQPDLSPYVQLTRLATESLAGIIKISTTAQVIAGTDNTTAVSPAKLKELYTSGSSKTQNGYQKLPNGVILQWGTIDYNSNPGEIAVDVVFPSGFPTSCLNVTATRKTLDNVYVDGGVGIVSYSSGSVKFQLNTWNSEGLSGLRGFTWFSIGY